MTDLSQMSEEDITRWGEDDSPEHHMGELSTSNFEGGDEHGQPV